jgi:2-phosphoglycerate kinase
MERIIAAFVVGILGIVAAVIAALIKTDRLIVTDLFRWKCTVPSGFVILINGGSGVGKTTVAWALARRFNIVSVIGTDLIREALRYDREQKPRRRNSKLDKSSFLAHENGDEDVVTAFEGQCRELVGPLSKIIKRVRTKRDPVIIEGVNLVASQVFEDNIPTDAYTKILFVNLYIQGRDRHIARLQDRGEKIHQLADRYVKNVEEIRLIDDFLQQDAQQLAEGCDKIMSIDNSGSLSHTVHLIARRFGELRRQRKKAGIPD